MTQHYQRGDAGAAMLVMMAVLMIGFFWHGGMGHGGDGNSHLSSNVNAGTSAKAPLDPLDETYARGEISPEKYRRRREDLPE